MFSRALLLSLGLVSSNAIDIDDVTVTNLRGGDQARPIQFQKEHVDDETLWEQGRLLTPSTVCPYPDSINLSPIRSGQYSTGDCFYMYWNSNKCNLKSKCPLYVYVDGTTLSEDVDDRDAFFMKEMAARGYVAVAADYDDSVMGYLDGCRGLENKSKNIFDDSIFGSVLHQLCQDDNNAFGHRNFVPVDCNKGVTVNGFSQGAQVTALAGNFSPFITAGLFWGCGHHSTVCVLKHPACSFCGSMDEPCMNSNQLILSKEKRRYINGEKDSYFGACDEWFGRNYRVSFPTPVLTMHYSFDTNVIFHHTCCYDTSLQENVIDQQRAVSGFSCQYSKDNCFSSDENQAGYFVVPGQTHDFMDVTPGSLFMDIYNPWGLKQNFDWLAREGRLVQLQSYDDSSTPTSFPTLAVTWPPTTSPTVNESV